MTYIAYNTRLIFKSTEDRQKMLETLVASQFCWNECSKIKFHIPSNSIVKLHASFYKNFRKLYPNIPCFFVAEAENSCLRAYKGAKAAKHKIKKIFVKRHLSIRLGRDGFNFKNNIVNLASIHGRVKCSLFIYPRLQKLLSDYKLADPTLFERDGDIWISLPFKNPEVNQIPKKSIGIDLGGRIPAATSEGKLYVDKNFNASKRRLRYLKRRLQSNGSKSSKKHLKKLSRKERNKNKDFCHKLANKILKDTTANVIAIENLQSIKVKKNKFKSQNRLSQIPLRQIRDFLTYKAALLGKTVILVCPSYTSQMDHRTGKCDGVRQGRRYIGADGQVLDADVNAACNIVIRSKHPASISNYFCWQAVAIQPIIS